MIENIEFKFGSEEGVPLKIDPRHITIFVGPNNSGKSQTLREMYKKCLGKHDEKTNVINNITFKPLEIDFIEKFLEGTTGLDIKNIKNNINFTKYSYKNYTNNIPFRLFLEALLDPNSSQYKEYFGAYFLRFHTVFLDGKQRTDLTNEQDGGDLQKEPVSSLQKLFRDDDLRRKFREIIFKGLGYYAIIDPTNSGKLRLRLSSTLPYPDDIENSDIIEKGLTNTSINFHKKAQLLSEASDGAKAFTGILLEIMTGEPNILIIDEPEAFLHPSLAFKLGNEIAKLLAQDNNDKQMFAATHSSHFLMGCIQAGVPINIVRLTYHKGHATARMLPHDSISDLIKKPLFRSTGVMAGLFYENVIVTEADSDRAFYQEINERLLEEGRGISNCLFLNAQNKQTIPEILAPLRKIGIPAAAICDIDFFKCGKNELNKFLDSSHIPEPSHESLRINRAKANKFLKTKEKTDYKVEGGINLLDGAELQFAQDHIKDWEEYGVFIVSHGELESWLPNLDTSGHGSKWLISAFKEMGDDPNKDDYVRPTAGDVWDFIDQIAEWLNNPNRKGIPSQTTPRPTE